MTSNKTYKQFKTYFAKTKKKKEFWNNQDNTNDYLKTSLYSVHRPCLYSHHCDRPSHTDHSLSHQK